MLSYRFLDEATGKKIEVFLFLLKIPVNNSDLSYKIELKFNFLQFSIYLNPFKVLKYWYQALKSLIFG